MAIIEPDGIGDSADGSFLVSWQDADGDDNASISLSYSLDSSCADATVFAAGISEDDANDSWLWNTSIVPEGEYWIRGDIEDSANPRVSVCSSGSVVRIPSPIFSDGFESGNTSAWQ